MKRVLIIEDHGQEMGKALDLLGEQGFDVTLCADSDGDLRDGGGWPQGPFADIIHNAPIGIFRSTPDGRFISVNPSLARILRYDSPEDLMETVNRKSIAEVLYPDPAQRREVVARTLSREGWHFYELQYLCKDGSIVTCRDYIRRVPGEEGRESELEGFVEDVTERKKAEALLKENLTRLQAMVRNAPIILYGVDREGIFTLSEGKGLAGMGLKPGEIVGQSVFDVFRDYPACQEYFRRALAGEAFKAPVHIGDHVFDAYHEPVYGEDGAYTGTYGVVVDVTEQSRAEEGLLRSEEKYRVVADFTYDWETWLEPEGRFIYVSPSCERITGYSADEFVNDTGLIMKIVHPDDLKDLTEHFGEVLKRDTDVQQIDFRIITKDGEERWIEHICQPVFGSDGTWLGRRASNRDSTDRKLAENRISAALAEKVLLLKEVHHRVKNNMQIITTLLDFQAESIHDKETVKAFRDCQDRIKAMAIIHERLYESTDMASIDFAGYVEGLSRYLFNTYLIDPGRVRLNIEAAGISLGIDRAIPCGLIINELLSNALKHAFPGNLKGEINVFFHRGDDGFITLRVSDNGVGLPAGLDFTRAETLGMQLVNMLVRQLRGEASVESVAGTAFAVRFHGGGATEITADSS